MNLLPYENLKIESSLSHNEIVSIVRNNIAWNTDLGMLFTTNSFRDYEGFVEGNTFKIRRTLKSGFNSFIPIVSGVVLEESNGSKIELKLRLHRLVTIFSIVFTIFLGSFLIYSEAFNEFQFSTWFLFVAPYFMSVIFFNYEAKIVKEKLKLMLTSGNKI